MERYEDCIINFRNYSGFVILCSLDRNNSVSGKVEAHKGTIAAENRTNGGALFTIKISTNISDMTNLQTENKI